MLSGEKSNNKGKKTKQEENLHFLPELLRSSIIGEKMNLTRINNKFSLL